MFLADEKVVLHAGSPLSFSIDHRVDRISDEVFLLVLGQFSEFIKIERLVIFPFVNTSREFLIWRVRTRFDLEANDS